MSLLPGHRVASTVAAVLAAVVLLGGSAATAAPPAPEDVAAQRAAADRLADDVETREADGDQARARLDELLLAAGAALEDYQAAEKAHFEAEANHWVQSERLDSAEQSLRASRGELGRWAAQTYRDGPASGAWGLDALLDATSTDDLGQRLSLLEIVARSQGDAVESLQTAAGTQAALTADAEATARAVMESTVRVTETKDESDRLVAEARAHLDAIDADLARSRQVAGAADAAADRLAAARALADAQAAEADRLERLQAAQLDEAARQGAAATRGATRQPGFSGGAGLSGSTVVGATGVCRGGDVSWFANGQIPAEALCPLWGARGHLLRADAAYAFDQLATAWAQDHGTPMCVTDSYRPLADQVSLFARKPHLAAKPGTSNHGWGVAIDLCGGIQRFGTAEHRWMQLNAPLYGWFHPRWAQQGGSRPEAWHWEYGG